MTSKRKWMKWRRRGFTKRFFFHAQLAILSAESYMSYNLQMKEYHQTRENEERRLASFVERTSDYEALKVRICSYIRMYSQLMQ